MRLGEFRKLTEGLSNDMEFLCAGGEIEIVWHANGQLNIDTDASVVDQFPDYTVIWKDEE